ncbi:MAG: hypothetical protein ACR2FY_17610 [Pirellulaceae bacterium]
MRSYEPPPDPIAFFLTWPTYGTWLPGDERGWIEYGQGFQLPDPIRKMEAEARMTEDACILNDEQRHLVEKTVADHCAIRGWVLHAVNCRTNHLHIVVTASLHPKKVRSQLKAWCTRRLKELEAKRRSTTNPKRERGSEEPPVRENWWVERGSGRYLNDQASLDAAIVYVRDGQ